MAAINEMIGSIRYKAQILARTTKLESGIMGMGLIGFSIGFLVALLMIVIPALLLGAN